MDRFAIVMMALLLPAIFAGCATTGDSAAAGNGRWSLARTPLNRTAPQLDVSTAEHLAWVDAYRQRILEVTEPRTVENTLVPLNHLRMDLEAVASECSLLANVHPDGGVRKTAEQGEQQATRKLSELMLDRELYEAIRAVDISRADAGTCYLVEKLVRDFRLAGVDRPDDVRARIAQLNDEIVLLGQTFQRNVREDIREITVESPADLEGMPADWIAAHPAGSDGKIHVTTQYPDYNPFLTYARNAGARQALYREFKNRGYPVNLEVLNQLIRKRHELATLMDYGHFADYVTADKMIGTAASAAAFIDRVSAVAKPAVERNMAVLLARKQQDTPTASTIEDWERDYYEQLVRTEQYQFDAQDARPYFNFPQVLDGLFTLTGRLFGVEYRQVRGLDLWHPDVTAWDLYEGRRHIGRFYLDLYPRENKYNHAACFGYREGVAGERLPQAVLVCNFPDVRKSPDGLALMEHDDVVTLFHEFGHLLHALFAGHQRWMGNSGISTEADFVEAPSQMLEEWCWDVETLQIFGRHHATGEPIPADLVQRMKRASDFGRALWVAHQTFYAAVSLNYYNNDPANLDTTALMTDLQARYSPFPYVPDTHFQCSFGHLYHYSAGYYTYLWSQVIAKDMFSRFQEEGLLNRRTSAQYRQRVLEPGGSKPAATLVQDFLGRVYEFDAFEAWLNRG